MNTILCTGWLQKPCVVAYTPAGRRKLTFDLMLAAVHPETEPTPWRCEVGDEELIARAEELLVPGRSVIIRGELHGRPFREHGVIKGFSRYLHITALEFARVERGNVAAMAETAGVDAT